MNNVIPLHPRVSSRTSCGWGCPCGAHAASQTLLRAVEAPTRRRRLRTRFQALRARLRAEVLAARTVC